MKKYIFLISIYLIFFLIFGSQPIAITINPKEAYAPATTYRPYKLKASSRNRIEKIVTKFVGWKKGRLVTKKGEYNLDNSVKLYDFVNSKEASQEKLRKTTVELIFVNDKLNIVIIRPK